MGGFPDGRGFQHQLSLSSVGKFEGRVCVVTYHKSEELIKACEGLSRSNSPPEVCRPPDTVLRSKSPPGHFTSKYLASRGQFTSVLPYSRLSPFVGGLFTSKESVRGASYFEGKCPGGVLLRGKVSGRHPTSK